MPKRVIISGGGTGGHIYPAIAIANELKTIDPTVEILFVGAEGKMEMEKVPRAGYQIIGLPVVGIKRQLTAENLAFPFKLGRSFWRARQVVRDFRPDVAVGVGGYASGPVLLAASLKGIPTLIQEQNSYAGLTNKLLSRRARTICVAYPGMDAFFPEEKLTLTGNPVRTDIMQAGMKRTEGLSFFQLEPERKTLLIIGGSQGARTINESVEKDLNLLIESGYQVVWQTGTAFIERARQAIADAGTDRIKAFDFIYEMDLAYAAADVVVSRAGALSISELCLVAKPAILVPLPTAAEDHQTKNALSLVNRNAALLVKDRDASTELVPAALRLLADAGQQVALSQNISGLARPKAAREIAEEVLRLIK
ncbi:UDP-N-acetylglucosamine-N-acetylmuramylpentapeptide N-acetylglucosamine transferase [Larkinella arboricola]|uniref:UDP-N-acetylglucosamine--N-acetylmuramyl-(pentapeptide) pyrophosphoryl-undecaprenol N-acetylglucosamine transferase n=1 Tax=Larkinella arboricola TaxID=643671 RepID=A0A327WZ59_LARAB|nr:undecaprenyldiphospho-muramoylpentapeptide beta-N-acetylglucosaminyltransferase [Larkinella arboricola]RAJ98016.1 UDP-N-acetylglucosamine-N-acetylmuramylpentapeptide N-acetylglucosamine transferase [Larkinella arboricola]